MSRMHTDRAKYNAKRILAFSKIVIIYYIIFHMYDCIWYFLGTDQDDMSPGPEGITFMSGWVYSKYNSLKRHEFFKIYISAYYFIVTTFATVGYGDITATNS